MDLGGGVHVRQECATPDPGAPTRSVDRDLVEPTQVNHEPVVDDRGARRVVRSAANGDHPVSAAGRSRRPRSTSAAFRQRAITAGRRLISPFHTDRAAS